MTESRAGTDGTRSCHALAGNVVALDERVLHGQERGPQDGFPLGGGNDGVPFVRDPSSTPGTGSQARRQVGGR